jgi:hypothetical protein
MPDRRTFLQALGAVGAVPLLPGVAPAGVHAVPVLAPRPTRGQPVDLGQFSVDLHVHSNRYVAQLPHTSPHEALVWFRDHHFNAAALTDLNHFTPVDKLGLDDPGWFLTIQGTEPSSEPDGVGVRIVDTLGVGVTKPLDLKPATNGESSLRIYNDQAKAIREAGGLPILAHMTMTRAGTADDLARSDPGGHARIFELVNTEPGIGWRGGGGLPGTEAMWDQALTKSRRRIYGIGASDSHHFRKWIKSDRPDEPLANPGRTWIMVRASELSWPALGKAIEAGDFYTVLGQTGITLLGFERSRTGIKLRLSPDTYDLGWSRGNHGRALFTTTFYGEGGKKLGEDVGYEPEYVFKTSDQTRYVRAVVEEADGDLAWVQPAFR